MRTADYIDGQESRRAFEAIARATVANGGGTFHHKTGAEINLQTKHAGGFVVSVEEYGSDIVTPIASAWERIAQLWPRTVGASVQYVGTWVDDGVVFVDGAVVVSTREHAEILARKHGQRAYFDIDAGESVYLDEPRVSVDDDARECFADDIATLRAIVEEALTSTDVDDHDRELRERLVSFIDGIAEIRA